MDSQTFLEHFGIIAEAPGGEQQLRDLILQLAVKGQLVAQDPSDQPAYVLIDRLAEARGSTGTPLKPVDRPSLPAGWCWTSFGDATINRDSERIPLKKDDRNTRHGRYDYYGASGVIDSIDDYIFDGELLLIGEDGANLVLRSTPIAFMASGRFWVNNHAHVVDSIDPVALRYLAIFINSIDLRPYLTGIAQPKLNQARMNGIPVPLPPLAEQKRIVTKVDELMELRDELKARQECRHRATRRLRGSALHALTEATTTDEIRQAWDRVSNHWSALSDHPDSIAAFRQTVLELAFEGRLAGRDEAGSQGVPPQVDRVAGPLDGSFPIPDHWTWARFDEVADSRLGKMLDKAKNTGPLRPYLRNANVQWFRFDLSDVHELRLEDRDLEAHVVRPGDLVICEGGEPGRVVVCDDTVSGMVIQKALHRARPRAGVDAWYLAYLLRCYAGSGFLSSFFTGATIKHLTGRSLGSVPVPIPSFAEQRRIVTAIEFLMAASDQLEEALAKRATAQVEAAVGLTRTASVLAATRITS